MTTLARHLMTIDGMSREQLDLILDQSETFVEVGERNVKKVPTLRGKTIVNLFLEPSTRTRSSFEIAGKRMSADVINISGSSSSTTKGETLVDTALTLQSMNPDIVVLRHASSGACHLISRFLKNCSIINAGDGLHEHPSQALLDALTLRQKLGKLDGLVVTMVGDALRSRVARSNIHLFKAYGCTVRVIAPPTLAYREFEQLGAEIYYDMEEGLVGSDVVISLRMKHEYMADFFVPNLDEYSKKYIVSEAFLSKYAPDSVVLCPGPMIRGVEITSEVADGPRSLISNQVNNGVAVRMALLYLYCRGRSAESIEELQTGSVEESHVG